MSSSVCEHLDSFERTLSRSYTQMKRGKIIRLRCSIMTSPGEGRALLRRYFVTI